MIAQLPPGKNHKSIAKDKSVTKLIPTFDETATVKWVPINKSFITLTKIILRVAAKRLAVADIAVIIRCINYEGNRHVILTSDEKEFSVITPGIAEEFIISTATSMNVAYESESLAESVTVPMNYDQQRIGYIVASLHKSSNYCDEIQPANVPLDDRKIVDDLVLLAVEIISIIKRYETRYRALFIYGDECYWIGNSLVLRQLEQRIDQLKPALHPVLIRGNKGTGKNIAARTLHCLRHANIMPFIESYCDEWQEGAAASILQALYLYAKGGTLFLRNVDKLSSANFHALEKFWLTKSNELADKGMENAVGLIFSVSKYDFVVEPVLSAWFKMNCIELRLPNLAERREDIRDLVRFFMREFTLSIEFDFSEEAWQILDDFIWQENVHELEKVIQKIALRTEKPLVTAETLISHLNLL